MKQITIYPKAARDVSTKYRPIVCVAVEKRLEPTPLPAIGAEIRIGENRALVLNKYFDASTAIIEFGCLNKDAFTLLVAIQASIDDNIGIVVSQPEIMEGSSQPVEA